MFLPSYTDRRLSEKKGRKEIIPSKHLKNICSYYIIMKKACQGLKTKNALNYQGNFSLLFVSMICGFVKLKQHIKVRFAVNVMTKHLVVAFGSVF